MYLKMWSEKTMLSEKEEIIRIEKVENQ